MFPGVDMLKPIAVAAVAFVLAARGQESAAPPPSGPDASATSASSAASPAFTGTIATLDLPGASSSSSSSSSSSGPARPVVVPPDKKTLRRLNDAVVTYVRNQRGWMDGTYKVYFYGYDNGLTVMAIELTQGDNAFNFVSAEGQPFKVEIDPATLKIMSERY